MKLEIPIVNAFVDGDKGGNPAGVVLNAERFSHQDKLDIAAAVGLSETAFVSPSASADFKLDFYTPTRQIAHCGHATIATFSYMSQQGLIENNHSSKETIDGRREIIIEGEMAYMEQVAPKYSGLSKKGLDTVYQSLGIDASALDPKIEPCIVNTGNSFLVAGFSSRDKLKSIKPDLELVSQFSERHDLIGYYLFTHDTFEPGRKASTRMFAPRYGIEEESATGMAAGPLACFLHDMMGIDETSLLIEQGYLMEPSSPSVIKVNLSKANQSISGLMAGGKATVSDYREIEI